MSYSEKCADRLKNSADRLSRLIELEAPSWFIAQEISVLYNAGMALYGPELGEAIGNSFRQQSLQKEGYCVACEGEPRVAEKHSMCTQCWEDTQKQIEEAEAFNVTDMGLFKTFKDDT